VQSSSTFPGLVCETPFQTTVRDLQSLAELYGESLGAQGKAIDTKLRAARQKFFQTPRDSSNYVKGWTELSQYLDAKDMWYLQIDLQAVPALPYPDWDGGIRRGAIPEWKEWGTRVRKLSGPKLGPFGNLSGFLTVRGGPGNRTFSEALEETQPLYDQYRLLRDWIEFSVAGRNITENPQQYGKYILALGRPWVFSVNLSRPDRNVHEHADSYYASMVEVYGEDCVIDATRQIMAAPKNELGRLRTPLLVDGRLVSSPNVVLDALIGHSSPRNYVISILDYYSCPTSLTGCRDLYNRVIVYFGENLVMEESRKIQRALKTGSGNLQDPSSLGVKSALPMKALAELLNARRNGGSGNPLANM